MLYPSKAGDTAQGQFQSLKVLSTVSFSCQSVQPPNIWWAWLEDCGKGRGRPAGSRDLVACGGPPQTEAQNPEALHSGDVLLANGELSSRQSLVKYRESSLSVSASAAPSLPGEENLMLMWLQVASYFQIIHPGHWPDVWQGVGVLRQCLGAASEAPTKERLQGTPEPKGQISPGWLDAIPEEKVLALDFWKDEPALFRQRSQD